MYTIKLNIKGKTVGTDDFFEFADGYFQSLYRTKQIVNGEWQYVPIEDGVSVYLFCPRAF